ncbi:MAG: hypothetical protein NZ455_13490 [Bacteroidia bacterium]|nr:hypothetical protein [Bacteroidia bacterium]MDW8348518.1 hypothetical protein [Bacteroidia bacterium]
MKQSNFQIYFVFILFITAVIWTSCSKTDPTGSLKPNKLPDTYTMVDTIIRTGDNRLISRVKIHWWGKDEDGFIKAYEISFDNLQWKRVWKQDSTFTLSPQTSDTADFIFYVRSIDNQNQADPTPARLRIPVKNSAPTVSYVSSGVNTPISAYPVYRYTWQGEDIDGIENINYYELVWNDTTNTNNYYRVPRTVNSIVIEAENPTDANTLLKVYYNNNTIPTSERMKGIKLNQKDSLYIRAVDVAGAKSKFKPSHQVYYKAISSTNTNKVLLVDGYYAMIANYPGNVSTRSFYEAELNNIGVTYDTLVLYRRSSSKFLNLPSDDFVASKTLQLFNIVLWYSGKTPEQSLGYIQKISNDFFNKGGRLFLSTPQNNTFDPLAPYYAFTPMDTLFGPNTSIGAGLYLQAIENDSLVATPNAIGYPNLKLSGFINSAIPFTVRATDEPVYAAQTINYNTGPAWTKSNIVMARRRQGGKTIFVVTTLELEKLNGKSNITQFFQHLVKNEFGAM